MTEPFVRYLRLLGIVGRPAGPDGLRTLVRRHLAAVPFENISKVLLYDRERPGRAISLTEFLDQVEFSDLGGTCYTCNSFFAELLGELGYDVDLLGADMSRPNVHTALRVRVDSMAYLVDVGFAAPFRDPIALDRLPAVVEEGDHRYVFEHDPEPGAIRLSMFKRDEYELRYVAHDPPLPRHFFDAEVSASYALTSTFMQRLRVSRVFESYSLDLIGRAFYRHEGAHTTVTQLSTMLELKEALSNQFAMPRCPVEAAIIVLERLTGKPFFA